MCSHIVDEGRTMITRSLRVSENCEGRGIARELKRHADDKAKQLGVTRKSLTFTNKPLLEKVQRENKRILFNKVYCQHYQTA